MARAHLLGWTLSVFLFFGCSQKSAEPEQSEKSPSAPVTNTASKTEPVSIAEECDRGDGDACHTVGKEHMERGEHTLARIAFNKGCDAGNAAACGESGKLAAQGFGGEIDGNAALEYYIKACSNGHYVSCTNAGRLTASEHLGAPDTVAALGFYEQACPLDREEMDAKGCDLMALSLMRGEANRVDFNLAKTVLTKACDAKFYGSCHNLGTLYSDGLGVEKDLEKALSLHLKACEGNSAEGCATAGVFYKRGLGVEKDIAKALSYLEKACNGGNKIACGELE